MAGRSQRDASVTKLKRGGLPPSKKHYYKLTRYVLLVAELIGKRMIKPIMVH